MSKVETKMVDITFPKNDGCVWINEDLVKFSVWEHQNPKLNLKQGDAYNMHVNVAGDPFEIVDCQPAVGWAVGTRWEVTCRRFIDPDTSLKFPTTVEDDDFETD